MKMKRGGNVENWTANSEAGTESTVVAARGIEYEEKLQDATLKEMIRERRSKNSYKTNGRKKQSTRKCSKNRTIRLGKGMGEGEGEREC